ncbi:coiled-coil alpha-helical rod protein 1-like [Orbicella faveolata]|uniref:coiled-coil alpha-helical rod protein 1-like n=1 Tax=Orbicella faveolata TaxID=48498 RepID=UPI0009E6016A|nr:coiled-coil alpha-helical rod protein 1-like [Orbicella faveolata]
MSDELSRREQIHVETKDKLTAVEEELKIFKEELKAKEREYSTNITKYQKKFKQVNQILTKLLKNYASPNCGKLAFYLLTAGKNNCAERKLKQGKLGGKEEELKAQNSVVDQLRAYITENLPNTQMEKLQKENEEAKQNITNLLQENEQLRSMVEPLNVRLSSMNEILSIQERELVKFQSKFTKGDSSQGDSLLTKWRENVIALLAQLKSQEITREKEGRNERAQEKPERFLTA